MGKSSQRKGKNGELELAEIMRTAGYQVKRGGSMTFGAVPDLSGLPGVHIEVKRVERLNLSEAMKQSTRDAERFRDGAPAVFHRKNHEGWLVTMPLYSWLEIYKAAAGKSEKNKNNRASPDTIKRLE